MNETMGTNFNPRDETRAEYSTLDVSVCMKSAHVAIKQNGLT